MNEIVDVFVAVGEFVGDKLVTQAFPGGVGGGVEKGDIDKGGVIDGIVFDKSGFDVLMPCILAVERAALIKRHRARRQNDDCSAGNKKQAEKYDDCPRGCVFHDRIVVWGC